MAVRSRAGRRARQRGFTYLGVLLAVALIGLGLTMAAEVWTTVAHRQKLEQLEFAGQQIAQAIGSYYESTPGPAKEYPRSLDDLLEDRRSPAVRRHLRQIYLNPFDRQGRWELMRVPGGGVVGVLAVVPDTAGRSQLRRKFLYSREGAAVPSVWRAGSRGNACNIDCRYNLASIRETLWQRGRDSGESRRTATRRRVRRLLRLQRGVARHRASRIDRPVSRGCRHWRASTRSGRRRCCEACDSPAQPALRRGAGLARAAVPRGRRRCGATLSRRATNAAPCSAP